MKNTHTVGFRCLGYRGEGQSGVEKGSKMGAPGDLKRYKIGVENEGEKR